MKILVIEDEEALRNNIIESLQKEQYIVSAAQDYWSALEKINVYHYDCILLDLMLPGGKGLDLLSTIKESEQNQNVIIISAKNALEDKIKGLELGADDYLTKPFHLAELNARIKAVLRRKQADGSESLKIGNIEIVFSERRVQINGQDVNLNRKEFDTLNYFLSNKNRLITKTALAEHVWGDDIDQADNFDFIYSQIKNLRKKMQVAGADLEIESVYGLGYRLTEK